MYVANGLGDLDPETVSDSASTTTNNDNGIGTGTNGDGHYDQYCYGGRGSILGKAIIKLFVLLLSLYWTLAVLMVSHLFGDCAYHCLYRR